MIYQTFNILMLKKEEKYSSISIYTAYLCED